MDRRGQAVLARMPCHRLGGRKVLINPFIQNLSRRSAYRKGWELLSFSPPVRNAEQLAGIRPQT